jgi:3-oxoacyl-[acyl-carrier protein] reductase
MPLLGIADGNLETLDKVIAINLRGTFLVLGQAARHLSEGSRIIALSSSVIAKGAPTYGPYIASKAGGRLGPGVGQRTARPEDHCDALAPAPVATELFLGGKTKEQIEQFSKAPLLERMGQPEDIANVVSFLAGPDGGRINAQVLRANDG